MTDIAVTWPKSRPYGSYIAEVHNAARDGLVLNYRVRSKPKGMPERCYMVYHDAVRCWLPICGIVFHEDGVVARVASDPLPGHWKAGWYIQRLPVLNELTKPHPMKGFRSYHYFDRTLVGA